ncbi:hypothetical protein PUN28_004013 [Cardiocondyla obscurior]|uniref:Uncharacterized protein n=1 Tax=Cardiocondyla obscurior TaxID=286306 RepID=A0AAW2GPB4_9HYME
MQEGKGSGKGQREGDGGEGNDLYPSGAKILPLVLVPPVEHPDGKWASVGWREREEGLLRELLIGVYIIFGRGSQLVGTTVAKPLPSELAAVGLTTDVYARDATQCSPKAH